MAEILDDFDFGSSGRVGTSKHDWPSWLDGRIHRLTADDLGGKIPKHFAFQARLVAKKLHLRVKCKVDKKEEVVVLQAVKMTADESAKADSQIAKAKANLAAKKNGATTTTVTTPTPAPTSQTAGGKGGKGGKGNRR